MLQEKDFLGLIRLLERDDEPLFKEVTSSIEGKDLDVLLPFLKKTLNETAQREDLKKGQSGFYLKEHLERWIDKIELVPLSKELCELLSAKSPDFLRCWYVLARIFFPVETPEWSDFQSSVNKKVYEIWVELKKDMTGFDQIQIMNSFFYERWKLDVLQEYDNPLSIGTKSCFDAFFAHNLYNKNQLNKFAMQIFYIYVANRNEIPVKGMYMLWSDVIVYASEQDAWKRDGVGFFIDMRSGKILEDSFLERFYSNPDKDLHICQMKKTMLFFIYTVLHNTYAMDNYKNKINIIESYVNIGKLDT